MNPESPTTTAVADDIAADVDAFKKSLDALRGQVSRIIVGQTEVTEALLTALLVGGHCLITGMPGTAKTLLVKTLATALGLTFKRVQFTPDLMPSDVTGTDIISEDKNTGERHWEFVEGPLFTNVLLADEINRTPPKTQAALLEAMQERSVTVRGTVRQLAPPFIVLATQNPIELEGTYPLPEAQLDRFLFNVLLTHLDAEGEAQVVTRFTQQLEMPTVEPVCDADTVIRMQQLVRQVPVSDRMTQFAVDIVRATRPDNDSSPDSVKKYVSFGASVRATLFLTLAAKANALMAGRYHVTADDVRAHAPAVLRHRVITNYYAEAEGISKDTVVADLLDAVDAP